MKRPKSTLLVLLALASVPLSLQLMGCQSGGRAAAAAPAGPRVELEAMIDRADGDFDGRQYDQAVARYKAIYAAANAQGLDDIAAEAAAMVAATVAIATVPGTSEATEGDRWMERAEELGDEQDDGAWTRVLLARGIRSWRAFDVERARGTFIYLYNYCFSHDRTPRAIQAAYMASLSSRGQEQLDWMKRAIEAARTTGNPKWEAPLWSQLARYYDELDRTDEALEAFIMARQLTARAQVTALARQRSELEYGHALRRVGRLEEASDQLEQTNAIVHSIYIQRPSPEAAELLGSVLAEMGEVYASLDRKDRARQNFSAARDKLLEAGPLLNAPARADQMLARIDALDAPPPDRVIPPKR